MKYAPAVPKEGLTFPAEATTLQVFGAGELLRLYTKAFFWTIMMCPYICGCDWSSPANLVMQVCRVWIVAFYSPCPPPDTTNIHTGVSIYHSLSLMNVNWGTQSQHLASIASPWMLPFYSMLSEYITFQADAIACTDSHFVRDYNYIGSTFISLILS